MKFLMTFSAQKSVYSYFSS